MNSYYEKFYVVAISLLIPFILNTATSYITQNDGYIQYGDVQEIQGKLYLPLAIGNYRDKIVDDFQFSFPTGTELTEIIRSSPLHIGRVPNLDDSNGEMRIALSGLPPHKEVSLLVPIRTREETDHFVPINHEQLKFEISQQNLSAPPLVRAVTEAIKYAVVTALVYAVMLLYMEYRRSLLLKTVEDVKGRLAQAKIDFDKQQEDLEIKTKAIRRETDEMQTRCHKHRIIMLARIKDYAKELDFWRNTIRKSIYSLTNDKEKARALFDSITESLKTYGTKAETEKEFEAIMVMADILNAPDCKSCATTPKRT